MLKKGAVEIVWVRVPAFYSRLFLVGKASGRWKPVINLSSLHGFLQTQNGDGGFSSGLHLERRNHGPDRPKGCLLLDPGTPGIETIFVIHRGIKDPLAQGSVLAFVQSHRYSQECSF